MSIPTQKFGFSRLFFLSYAVILLALPVQQASANGSIANAVLAACAPNPTVPDVNSCSACHSTTNNRSRNDLTTQGQWALSSSTYTNFCPNSNPNPNPTPPPPSTGMGMSAQPPGTGIGMGRGGDDDEYDDDDDDSGSSSRFRSRSSSFSRSRGRGDD